MNKIVFIDNTSEHTHQSIKNKGLGASEYQYYNLVEQFSRICNEKILCYNGVNNENLELNNVIYKNIRYFNEITIEDNSIFIIQRFYPIEEKIINKLNNFKSYLWIHDIPHIYIFLGNNDPII